MTDERPRRRQGLEGLPVSEGEVWAFDAARRMSGGGGGDLGGLVLLWVLALGSLALGVWGGSITLVVCGAVASAIATWWTVTKTRSHLAARRQSRRP